jgi:transitional endoplasmic reticulum ATPase
MAEVLLEFQTPVFARDGTAYRARACGGEAGDGTNRWHGWIEFVPAGGGVTIRTPRETSQPNRTDTAYWATGLTAVYLEGALQRALHPTVMPIRPPTPAMPGGDEAPAPDFVGAAGSHPSEPPVVGHRPIRASAGGARSPGARTAAPSKRAAATPPVLCFSDVGGMDSLKAEVRRIVELIHIHREQAQQYGIVRNGILLHGPPGCGKTFFTQAMAGEFGLRFLRVPLGSAISKYVGGAPEAIERVFRDAHAATPCLLFFDEFDAIACKRHDVLTLQEQQMVNALLQQLDAHREVPGLLIVAATNRFDDLDAAVIREGRFDYKVKISRPDLGARREILRVLLRKRPHALRIDTSRLAHDLDGFSAAQIQNLVDEAALIALETAVPIANRHLRAAYRAHVAASSYGGPKLGWDELILPFETKQKLQLIEKFIENPHLARELGVAPPTGILLFGPPGTGKTTIARVLASETEAAFFAGNAADILSKWLGDSERRVKELFTRAREQVPAIIFIDEIDALLERRGEALSGGDHARNAIVNTFLAEMDGLEASARIFVIGATNRAELLDEALLRPGRLGEAIEIALPDATGREALLKLCSTKMRLAPSVDLENLAAQTEGASGADLKGLCTLAGRNAFVRELEAGHAGAPAVTSDDFERALDEIMARRAWTRERRPIGFQPRES